MKWGDVRAGDLLHVGDYPPASCFCLVTSVVKMANSLSAKALRITYVRNDSTTDFWWATPETRMSQTITVFR